jgi:lysophospholipase L1-like esterase
MDVYDASKGLSDDWIIYGSSTPSMAMQHTVIGNNAQSFSQIINAARPAFFPVQENGSISGIDTVDGVNNINTWLAIFPGHYVAIALGANDADECMSNTTFYNNYATMIRAVTSAGKVPVVPLFNWSKLSTVQSCGPRLIDQINKLYVDFPQVVKGPDFWTYFMSHPELISSDDTHPTDVGLGIYRQMWADTMVANVYN